VTVAAPDMASGGTGSHALGWVDSSYMRALALRCTLVARDCPHRPTSLELEALSAELMDKATEIDELIQTYGSDDRPHEAGAGAKKRKT
jgi:hypothetical protein